MRNEDSPSLYLASASPRRARLLGSVGLSFEVLAAAIDETRHPRESSADYVMRMAKEKATRVLDLIRARGMPPLPVLAADTAVVIDDDVLGKPRDADHAKSMLQRMSGGEHTVLSGVAVCWAGQCRDALSVTRVTFKALTGREIAAYCRTSEPLDKAGGYAIQGKACGFVSHISGSYTGVVGLPMYETRELLRHAGLDWL